jgi:hypothetical protein
MLFGREMNLPIDLVLGRHGCNEYSHELKTVYADETSEKRRGFAPGFVNYKKAALDSQPQVITFTSCLPMDLFKVIKRKVILNSLGIFLL